MHRTHPPLSAYRTAASTCLRCHEDGLLHRHPDGRQAQPLFHLDGSDRAGVVVVFEAPNMLDTYDPKKGRITCGPFTDPSGSFFFDLLAHVGLRPQDVVITNSVLCLPAESNGKYPVRARQQKACSEWLARLISDLNAKVVVTCGVTALAAIGRIVPHGLRLKSDAGIARPWNGRHLLPLYHPSALGRISRDKEAQLRDIEALRPFLPGHAPKRSHYDLPGF